MDVDVGEDGAVDERVETGIKMKMQVWARARAMERGDGGARVNTEGVTPTENEDYLVPRYLYLVPRTSIR